MKNDGLVVLTFFVAVFLLITGIRIFVTGEMPVGTRSGYVDIGNISYLFGSIFIGFSLRIFYYLFFEEKVEPK